jgi:hypothetical protein
MFERAVSLPSIGALLGHKHSATTARYAHLAPGPLRSANEAVGSRIAAAMGLAVPPENPATQPKRATKKHCFPNQSLRELLAPSRNLQPSDYERATLAEKINKYCYFHA